MYEQHLATIRAGYRRKRDVMVRALRRLDGARFEVPAGGLYVWLELPDGVATGVDSPLFKAAFARGLLYVPGEMCYCRDRSRATPQNQIRLSYGAARVGVIRRGIALLGEALRETTA